MAAELDRPLITVACNEDTSAADLIGRFLIRGGDTVWQDGPAVRAVRESAFLYLDEVSEAREDVIVVLHSLSDDRRELQIDRLGEVLKAGPRFQLVASFNPGYQGGLKDLKPSTRQRFVSIALGFPEESIEAEIIERETGCDPSVARKLCALARQVRTLEELSLRETLSTRLLVSTALLIRGGLDPRTACEAGIAHALTDDLPTATALRDLCNLRF